jgi:hypothetical protein
MIGPESWPALGDVTPRRLRARVRARRVWVRRVCRFRSRCGSSWLPSLLTLDQGRFGVGARLCAGHASGLDGDAAHADVVAAGDGGGDGDVGDPGDGCGLDVAAWWLVGAEVWSESGFVDVIWFTLFVVTAPPNRLRTLLGSPRCSSESSFGGAPLRQITDTLTQAVVVRRVVDEGLVLAEVVTPLAQSRPSLLCRTFLRWRVASIRIRRADVALHLLSIHLLRIPNVRADGARALTRLRLRL